LKVLIFRVICLELTASDVANDLDDKYGMPERRQLLAQKEYNSTEEWNVYHYKSANPKFRTLLCFIDVNKDPH